MMGRSRCPGLGWVSGDSWCRSRTGECAEHGHVLGKSAQAQVIGKHHITRPRSTPP
jgi:hypothetical protein